MKSIPVELDKVRNIRLGVAAMQTIQKLLKKPLVKIELDNIDEMLTVVVVGMQHEDKDMNKERLTELIDEYSDLETIITATTDAIAESYGKNV